MKTYYLPDGRRVEVTTGCIGRKTLLQGIVLALVVGPLVWSFEGGSLIWCMVAMFLAPFLVDAIKPVHTYYPPNNTAK